MACFSCMPDCDKCIPKFIDCPACGQRCSLADPVCEGCGHAFTEAELDMAKKSWLADLMIRNKPKKARASNILSPEKERQGFPFEVESVYLDINPLESEEESLNLATSISLESMNEYC